MKQFKQLVPVALISVSLAALVLSHYMGLVVGLCVFFASLVGISLSLLDIGLTLKKLQRLQSQLQEDKRGLAWVWIAGLVLTLPFCALLYWVLDYPFDMIVATVSPMYTFTGTMAMAWTTAQLLLSYLLSFVIVFAVLWVIVNAKNPSWVN